MLHFEVYLNYIPNSIDLAGFDIRGHIHSQLMVLILLL